VFVSAWNGMVMTAESYSWARGWDVILASSIRDQGLWWPHDKNDQPPPPPPWPGQP